MRAKEETKRLSSLEIRGRLGFAVLEPAERLRN
jgi:hypothetical protein